MQAIDGKFRAARNTMVNLVTHPISLERAASKNSANIRSYFKRKRKKNYKFLSRILGIVALLCENDLLHV